jgi:hypothetical protein
MSGGLDSMNLIVPHSECDLVGKDMYAEYEARLKRGPSVILPPSLSFIWRIPIRGTHSSDE